MSTFEEMSADVMNKATKFLSDKPIWAHWIVYTLAIGVLFGIFYALFYLLALKWWVLVLTILAAGILAGTIAYYNKKNTDTGE